MILLRIMRQVHYVHYLRIYRRWTKVDIGFLYYFNTCYTCVILYVTRTCYTVNASLRGGCAAITREEFLHVARFNERWRAQELRKIDISDTCSLRRIFLYSATISPCASMGHGLSGDLYESVASQKVSPHFTSGCFILIYVNYLYKTWISPRKVWN